jgi:hypothetical protein
VEISREELAERFRALSDEQLLSRLDFELTPLALEVVKAELQSRGIEPQAEATNGADDADDAEDSPAVDLVTVAEFWNPLQANLLRSCLESCGIPAHVWGEHLGTTNLFLSVASGGIRLQVRSDQMTEAKEVIAAFERGDFEMDEEPE